MAVTEEIAWGDGSGDKIYLTADALEGNQTVLVSSDANTGAARTKTVTFSATGASSVTLTVIQAAGIQPVFRSYLFFDGTAYVDTDIPFTENSTFRFTGGLESLEGMQRLFMFGSTLGSHVGSTQTSATNATSRAFSAYYCSSSSLPSPTPTVAQTTPTYSYFLTPKLIGFGSSTTSFTKGSTAPDGNLIIGSNYNHGGQGYTGIFSRFRIYGSDAQNVTTSSDLDNYTPIHDLRPCIYGTEHGFWDTVGEKFYGNSAGSGTLLAVSAFSGNPSSYDSTDKSYYSISNASNAYAGYSSTTYATIELTRGSRAETYVYFKFDTSSIPADATIVYVFCSAKAYISSTASNQIASRQIQLYCGTTAKGTASTVTTTATVFKLYSGTMTREEASDIRVRLYAKRGTSNTTDSRTMRLYGATLYVLYTT